MRITVPCKTCGKREALKQVSQRIWTICPELTNYCNYNCPKCPQSLAGDKFTRPMGYMSQEIFDIVIDNANKYAKRLNIGFFGEQLMHPNFSKLVEQASHPGKKYELSLNTNWSLVTADTMETLKRFDNIRISLDACDPDTYDKLQSGGAVLDLDGNLSNERYNTIIDKLEYWMNISKHPSTRIVYTTSSENVHNRDKFVQYITPKLTRKDYVLTKIMLSYGGVMYNSYMKPNPCNVPDYNWFIVAWNGDCSPCNLDVNMAWASGNILDDLDLRLIVLSDKWQRTIQNIKDKQGICADCFDANNWTESVRHHGTT